MKLDLAVTTNDGKPATAAVDLELSDTVELAQVVKLAGSEAFTRLASGRWDETAARAILYVKLAPDCAFDDFTVDWPADLDFAETTLPMEPPS